MIRTQIQLTDEQARLLRQMATDEGRSMAELIRDAVAALLRRHYCRDRETLKRQSLSSLGRFRSGASDLASAHDRHLDDAFSL